MLAINGGTVDLPAITQSSLYLWGRRDVFVSVCFVGGGLLLTDIVVWMEACFSEKDSFFKVRRRDHTELHALQTSPVIICQHWG